MVVNRHADVGDNTLAKPADEIIPHRAREPEQNSDDKAGQKVSGEVVAKAHALTDVRVRRCGKSAIDDDAERRWQNERQRGSKHKKNRESRKQSFVAQHKGRKPQQWLDGARFGAVFGVARKVGRKARSPIEVGARIARSLVGSVAHDQAFGPPSPVDIGGTNSITV